MFFTRPQESGILPCLDSVSKLAFSLLTFVAIITRRKAPQQVQPPGAFSSSRNGSGGPQPFATPAANSWGAGDAYSASTSAFPGGPPPLPTQPATPGGGAPLLGTPATPAAPDSSVTVGESFEVDIECVGMTSAALEVGIFWLDTILIAKESRRPTVDKSRCDSRLLAPWEARAPFRCPFSVRSHHLEYVPFAAALTPLL